MVDPRTWLAVVLVLAGVALQVTLVTRVPFPGGVAPDLVLVVVAALAARTGPLRGCVTGFAAGLLADVAPPAFHTVGRFAVVYCVIGYLVGVIAEEVSDSPALTLLAVSLGALVGTLLYTGMGALFSDPRVTWEALARIAPLSVLYDVLLSPFVLYAVTRLVDVVDPRWAGWRGLRGYRPSP